MEVVESAEVRSRCVEHQVQATRRCWGWEEASQAVAAPCQELERQLRDEPVLNADEIGLADQRRQAIPVGL